MAKAAQIGMFPERSRLSRDRSGCAPAAPRGAFTPPPRRKDRPLAVGPRGAAALGAAGRRERDFHSSTPATLTENNLNGAQIHLRARTGRRFTSASTSTGQYTLSGYPAGTTVSVTGAARYDVSGDRNKGLTLTLGVSGTALTLSSPMSLSITIAATSVLNSFGNPATVTVQVLPVSGSGPSLRFGAVNNAVGASGIPGAITAEWTDPSGVTATGYQARFKLASAGSYPASGAGAWKDVTAAGTTTKSTTVFTSHPGQSVVLQVRIKTGSGGSAAVSAASTATAITTAALAAPTGLSADPAAAAGEVRLAFTRGYSPAAHETSNFPDDGVDQYQSRLHTSPLPAWARPGRTSRAAGSSPASPPGPGTSSGSAPGTRSPAVPPPPPPFPPMPAAPPRRGRSTRRRATATGRSS